MKPFLTIVASLLLWVLPAAVPAQGVPDLFLQAEELDRQGFFEDAIQAWKKALAANLGKDQQVVARIKLSMDHYKLNQFDIAVEHAQALVKSEPENFHANFHLGNILSGLNRFPDAIAAYEKAVKLRPDEGLGYAGLALCLYGNGQTQEAIARLTEAKQIFKDKKNISWHRDTQLMMQQIKMFDQAGYPPSFSNLWLKNNLNLVRETYEKTTFNQ